MNLQVLVSKKGTKVVKATNLYDVLQLPKAQYNRNVRFWLNDVYEFKDGIRKPEKLKDYSGRKNNNPILKDYYVSVELAKLITLNSTSKVKRKFANRLLGLEDQVENSELLSIDQVKTIMEVSKVMGLMSVQASSEKGHLNRYEDENGSAANWWNYRSELLGNVTDKLKESLKKQGEKIAHLSQKRILMKTDKYEMIRSGVVDLFMAMGKNEQSALNLGNLAKYFAKELKVDVWDDRNLPQSFTSGMNQNLINEISGVRNGQQASIW